MHSPPPSPLRRRRLDAVLTLVAAALLTVALALPEARRVDLGGGTLVVADLRGQALTVLDLESGGRRRIALGGGPHELLLLPDGRVAASLEQAGRLALIDLASERVAYLETGGQPHGLAIDDGTLLVTDRAAGAVRRFEVGGWAELVPIAAGAVPHQLAIAGGVVVVADAASEQIVLGGRSERQPALTESVAASADGARVAIAGARDGLVRVLERDGGAALDVALGGRPVRVTFAPSGAVLAVALSAEAAVALVDPNGRVRRVAVPGVPDGLAFDATGRLLFASDIAGGAVSVIEVGSGRIVARLDGGMTAGALLVVP